jgi:hypothetical protein
MTLKLINPGVLSVLLLVVFCIVIHDVAGGLSDRFQRAATSRRCGFSVAARELSVGGSHTKPNTWPWLVALYKELPKRKTEFFCAGSLIAQRHVVSGMNDIILRCYSSLIYHFSCALFPLKV